MLPCDSTAPDQPATPPSWFPWNLFFARHSPRHLTPSSGPARGGVSIKHWPGGREGAQGALLYPLVGGGGEERAVPAAAVYSVDYAVIMGCMDHVKGTPTEGQLQR